MKFAEPVGAAYGPGANFAINTNQEYHIKTEFLTTTDGEQLASYVTTLTQGSSTVVLENDCDDLAKMTEAITENMTPVLTVSKSNGLGKNGLCGASIDTDACVDPTSTYKNFKITTAAGGDDGGDDGDSDGDNQLVIDTTFEDYTFGSPCDAGACHVDCFDCR